MYAISSERARHAGLAIVLAAGFFFLPVTAGHVGQIGYASAWAGNQGGGHDKVPRDPKLYGIFGTGAGAGDALQFLHEWAMGSGYVPPVQQPYTNYSAPDSPPATATPCQSCLNGAIGTGFTPPFSR